VSKWNKFLVHDAFNVKKINTGFTLLRICRVFFSCGEVGVFHWNDCWLVSTSCPNTQDSSPIMMVKIKWGHFLPVPWVQCRQECGVPFGHCSVTLAQILLQCAACWSHPTKFARTFHTTVRNAANIVNRSSSVFQDSLSHFCHIFGSGSGLRLSRTLFIIDWHPSFLIKA